MRAPCERLQITGLKMQSGGRFEAESQRASIPEASRSFGSDGIICGHAVLCPGQKGTSSRHCAPRLARASAATEQALSAANSRSHTLCSMEERLRWMQTPYCFISGRQSDTTREKNAAKGTTGLRGAALDILEEEETSRREVALGLAD